VISKPQGAFYGVVRLPVSDSEDFASYLLSEFLQGGATIFVAPAEGFYMADKRGFNKIRIAFVLNRSELIKAVDILDAGLKAYLNSD